MKGGFVRTLGTPSPYASDISINLSQQYSPASLNKIHKWLHQWWKFFESQKVMASYCLHQELWDGTNENITMPWIQTSVSTKFIAILCIQFTFNLLSLLCALPMPILILYLRLLARTLDLCSVPTTVIYNYNIPHHT